MIHLASISVSGSIGKVEFVGGTSAEVKQQVERHIQENGKPEIVSGMFKQNPFRYVQRLYYRMGVNNA